MTSSKIKRYRITIITLIFFIFMFWLIRGYYTTVHRDAMKELLGNAI